MFATILNARNIFLFFAVFLAYFTKSITGFGNTLVMGPLFSFVVSNRITTPVDLLMSVPTNAFISWRERKFISARIVIPLSVMLIAGIIPGTFFLKIGADWILKAILGLVIIAMAIEIMFRSRAARKEMRNPVFLTIIGIISGVLAGIFGIGALVTVYVSKTTGNKHEFRSNVCFVFLVENLFRFFLYWATGLFTKQIILLTLGLFPAVALGMLCGVRADKYIGENTMRTIMISLLLASGFVLFITNAFFH